MKNRRMVFAALLCGALLFVQAGGVAQESQLGRVEFPTSGSPAAQRHFLRGVAALHSFWFEEALEAFRASTAAEPGFLMGYWGEAMAHNHPLWAEQDTEAARRVLEKITDTSKLTPREQAYIAAVRVLYGKGDKLIRDKAYAAMMEKIYRDYPQDLEAASFYSLALLGTVRPGDTGYRTQARAGAVALDVYQKNPNHPGAAHYIIHSFDDPDHAILALPAARRYAEIAPEAHHARHMPSHIFIQLGMWPEAAASNVSAWEASVNWVNAKKLPGTNRDFHSLHWLFYVRLQQGRYAEAQQIFDLRRKALAEMDSGGSAMGTARPDRYYADMAAELVMETEQWQRAAELFPSTAAQAPAAPGEHIHGAAPAAAGGPTRLKVMAEYTLGMAAAGRDAAEAKRAHAQLSGFQTQLYRDGQSYRGKHVEVMALQVLARERAAARDFTKAVEAAQAAVRIEESMSPPSGPPEMIKPAHELAGEILLQAGRPEDAVELFVKSLQRQPNRARSLLGAARAAARSKQKEVAAAYYGQLLDIWQQADSSLAELREAREFAGTQARATASR